MTKIDPKELLLQQANKYSGKRAAWFRYLSRGRHKPQQLLKYLLAVGPKDRKYYKQLLNGKTSSRVNIPPKTKTKYAPKITLAKKKYI